MFSKPMGNWQKFLPMWVSTRKTSMFKVHEAIELLRSSKRAAYMFDTKVVAEASGLGETRFGQWWDRTRDRLKVIAMVQPGQLAAEMIAILVEAEADREVIEARQSPKK